MKLQLQIGLADFDHLPAHPQARDRQQQVFAGQHDQVQLRGLALDQKGDQP